MSVKNSILLTGAGFSKNFGGFLASELWGRIFSHPALINYRSSKTWLHDNFDYETVYYRIQNNAMLTPEEKTAMTAAVLQSYHDQENMFAAWSDKAGPPCPLN